MSFVPLPNRMNMIPGQNPMMPQTTPVFPNPMLYPLYKQPVLPIPSQPGLPIIMNIPINPMLQIQSQYKKVWIGKIPDNITDSFMQKLLETCGQVTSWNRLSDRNGKPNSFGICEYVTVEGMLKCLRLINNLKMNESNLQAKISPETEEFLKTWREHKKSEWIDSYTMRGLPLDPKEIKAKEDKGEPLEWELELVNRDQETLTQINLVINQKEQIDLIEKQQKQIEKEKSEEYLKELKEFATNSNLNNYNECEREKNRKKKKSDKFKKMEKNFKEEEKKWLRHEENREKDSLKKVKDKENYKYRIDKLIYKDLNFIDEVPKNKDDELKLKDHLKMRMKEKEYDDKMRKKENDLVFKNVGKNNNEIKTDKADKEDNDKEMSTALVSVGKEQEAKTKLELEEYDIENKGNNDIKKDNNGTKKDKNKDNDNDNDNNKDLFQLNIKKDIAGNINSTINNGDEIIDDDLYNKRKISDIGIINPETEKDLLNIKNNEKINIENNYKNDKMDIDDEDINKDKQNELIPFEQIVKEITPDKFKEIQKNIIKILPNNKEDLLKFKINWDIINNYKIKNNKIKPWVEKKLVKYFDEDDTFSNFLIEKIGVNSPDEIYESVKTVLEGDADGFMCNLWKTIIFEYLKIEKSLEEYKKIHNKK